MSLLARLAARARAPVFVLVGEGGRQTARRVLLDARVQAARSPRHATVLLVVGALPEALWDAARRVHDQVPEPRATVVVEGGEGGSPFEGATVVEDPAKVADAVVAVHRALVTGERESERAFGPEDSPVEWKGVGPHGQGGKGMMGGKPYGRPMAMTGPDLRDGLELDRVTVPLGPFLGWLPPGLCIDVVMQGDVVQEARLHVAFASARDEPEVFARAREGEVPLAELEVARARHHLLATADLLALHGLGAQAARVARLGFEVTPADGARVRRWSRRLGGWGALRLGLRGVGTLAAEQIDERMGPVARASGIAADVRADDPAYAELGFAPVTRSRGDAQARLVQRLEEAAQALELAGRAGDRLRAPGPVLEGPRGSLPEDAGAAWRELLEGVAPGQAFDAFASTVVSLDLDAAVIPERPPEEEEEEDDGDEHGGHGDDEHGGHGDGDDEHGGHGDDDDEHGDDDDHDEHGEGDCGHHGGGR